MPTPLISLQLDRSLQLRQAPPLPPRVRNQAPPRPLAELPQLTSEIQRPVTKLEALLEKQLTAISNAKPCVNPNKQRPAKKEQIGVLRKDGQGYQLDYPSCEKKQPQKPDGAYIFVIKALDPNKVMLGRLHAPDFCPNELDMEVDGHTSLTKREDVLFAGEALFSNGTLRRWTNASGHYRPKSSSVNVSLLPYPAMLLSLDKYKEVIRDDGMIVHDPEIDRANGYLEAWDNSSDQSIA